MEKAPEWMEGLKLGRLTRKPNYLLIPVSALEMGDEGIRRFNEVSHALSLTGWPQIVRTPSHGIARSTPRPSYDVITSNYMAEITALTPWGNFRLQFKNAASDRRMRGRRAFRAFRRALMEDGIDLTDYALGSLEEAELQKGMIDPPPIGFALPGVEDVVWRSVHHIDFHSSFPAGLAKAVPEFRPAIERLYEAKERGDEMAKATLNMAIGFMQSIRGCNARWAHLSRQAIDDSNMRVYALSKELAMHGRTPLCYNTDGIWYAGDVYHGEGEGPGLGQWHNDHVNCRWRAKSPGAYEFIERGQYHAVVRGVPLERKAGWSWGSIYSLEAEPEIYEYDEERKEIRKHGEEETPDEQGGMERLSGGARL